MEKIIKNHKISLNEDREGNYVVEVYDTENHYTDDRESFESYEEAEKFYNERIENYSDKSSNEN